MITKKDLVKELHAVLTDYSLKDLSYAVHLIFTSMSNTIKRGERVEIRGFGSFTVRHRKISKSSKNNTPVQERQVPFFKAGKELKNMINKLS
jgi:integration host factor subunit beta